jgi:ribosomal-protein-alanine N-acetyltransferase
LGAALTRRKLAAGDLGQLLSLEFQTQDEPWSFEHFLAELDRPFEAPLGLFAGKDLAAFLFAWLLPPEAHLLRLAVVPDRQGQGLAAVLLASLVQLTQAAGGDRILLEVAEGNVRAIQLYRAAGFLVDGRAKKYYAKADALRMSLALADWPGLTGEPARLFKSLILK